MTMCMLELLVHCGKISGEKRLWNPGKLRPSPLNNPNRTIEVFSHCHSFRTSFRSLDRLSPQPYLRSQKVYQGGRDEGHLQTVTVQSPWSIVSCTYERPYVGMQYFIMEDLCITEISCGVTKKSVVINNWPLIYLRLHLQLHQERNHLEIYVIYLENKEICWVLKTCYIISVLFSSDSLLFHNFRFFSSNNKFFYIKKLKVKVKVKQSRHRPGVAQRVPGS
jgi:hypothetical protein